MSKKIANISFLLGIIIIITWLLAGIIVDVLLIKFNPFAHTKIQCIVYEETCKVNVVLKENEQKLNKMINNIN
jgi:hypothetical protein